MDRRLLSWIALISTMLPLSSWAHHSTNAYDTTRIVTQQGILRDFNFENPHVNMHLDVQGSDGKLVSFYIEGAPPGWFRAAGIRAADFGKGVGKPVTLAIHPSKDGSPIGFFQKITFDDGTFITFSDVYSK